MTPTLLVQHRVGRAREEISKLEAAARDAGWIVLTAPTSWRLSDEQCNSISGGVPYGALLFCEVIAQQLGRELRYNSFDWLAGLSTRFLGRTVEFMPLSEATALDRRAFVKPADDKCFVADVYEPGELVVAENVPADTPTLVSYIVQFDAEFRCFVGGGEVRTWSRYMTGGALCRPEDYRRPAAVGSPVEFVQDLLTEFDTEPSVVDVGTIDGSWAVVESNPAWASGLYGCDPAEALGVIEASVVNLKSSH